MQKPKSKRHVNAARSGWRAAEARAEAEREAGIPDRQPIVDCRDVVALDLTSWGGKRWRIEPRLGYVAGRAIDEASGAVEHCATIKELLHKIADEMPRILGSRNLS